MEEMHALIREAAQLYILKRNPQASRQEIEYWQKLVTATADQETFFSHYRSASDQRLKMMRGDIGHGHGMMQVDDRHHFPAIQQGIGWNLMGNLVYAMDILYPQWTRAPSQTCVGSSTNYEARMRAAWAAYNGGPSKICRFTNPNDKFANNDKGFHSKLKSQSWKKYVADLNKEASVDVSCLMENREDCPPPGDGTGSQVLEHTLYKQENFYCVRSGTKLSCVEESKNAVCLDTISKLNSLDSRTLPQHNLAVEIVDRHKICSQFSSLLKVGNFLETKQAIFLRATPGGGALGVIPKGEILEVSDFEIRNLDSKDRYYKINLEGKIGYFYAGSASSYASWAIKSDQTAPIPSQIARIGEKIRIKNSAGINMRKTPGGSLIGNIPKAKELTVLSYIIQGSQNYLYYMVSYNGKAGYVYSGFLEPNSSVHLWTERVR